MEATTAPSRIRFRSLSAAVAGNALEFYDFLAYAYFAVFIGRAFFPAASAYASLMASIAVFGVGFIFRPLGGLAIGRVADRAGRRPAMVLSLALASAGTLGIALTPGYATIGIAAPLLIVICRAVQGFALGGEVGPATAFLLEVAPSGRRALFASLQSSSQFMGSIVASGAGLLVALALPRPALEAWGWRLPVALVAVFVPLILFLRRHMPETGAPLGRTRARVPLRPYWREIVATLLLNLSGTVGIYAGVYLPTFGLAVLHLSPSASLAAGFAGAAAGAVAAIAGGWLADRLGRKPVILGGKLALAALIWPLFAALVARPSPASLVAASIAVTGLAAFGAGPGFALGPELLPRSMRAGIFSLLYALSVALFGGTAQLIFTWAVHASGDPRAPAWYVLAMSLVSVIALRLVPETKCRPLD